ncbi:hypothetical protein [Metabacillus fastidiosus]|uniref:hypothetical protein n=1 Tax=Metabacillus fastidiosus TaxID=1458 RepID=UPI003D2BB34D
MDKEFLTMLEALWIQLKPLLIILSIAFLITTIVMFLHQYKHRLLAILILSSSVGVFSGIVWAVVDFNWG